LSPYLALYIRDAQILYKSPEMAVLYCLISCLFTLGCCLAFRIDRAIPQFFAVSDALNLVKAVVVSELLTAVTIFSVTRLDGVPRSVPMIHAIILGVWLFAALGLVRFVNARRGTAGRERPLVRENIILIGLNGVSAFFIKFLEEPAARRFQVVALLDTEPRWVGRTVNGVCVLGPPSHLASLVAEFAEHGVRIDKVVVAGNPKLLPIEQIRDSCERLKIDLEFAADYLGSRAGTDPASRGRRTTEPTRRYHVWPAVRRSDYFFIKTRVEFPITVVLIFLVLPGFLIASLLSLLDVGPPILFWQQRIGLHGGDFRLYKIRTLRHAFDNDGREIPLEQRLSWVGRLLRRTRLDELPQLLNVLVGDMALIGPRPLLPRDQPPNSSVRLSVRPGLTGWAQVNGGVLLSPEEKEGLDAWYIRHASLRLDLRIAALSVWCVLRGDRKSEKAIARARALMEQPLVATPIRTPESGFALNAKGNRSTMATRV
jgi:lipopolysaccharide/colanic/teichoic acid biosynthesis glycosyltransferase